MNHLIDSLEHALNTKNHYPALAIALALPDICGWIEDPKQFSKSRCIAWFEKYMQPTYFRPATKLIPEHTFLTGKDFYALRCAFLHEGRDEIIDQKAQEVLEKFQFVVPPEGWRVHRNQNNNTLQLQVDVFCREIADGVKRFITDVANNPDAMQRMSQLLLIRDINGNPLQIPA